MRNHHQTSPPKIFFENLDGLRFIAFLLVFLSHAIRWSAPNLNIRGTFIERILFVIASGTTGVSIFFVLSGFLITYLLLTEKNLHKRINVPFFYMRRALRIWPLYYIVVTLALLIYPFIRSQLGKPNALPHHPYFYFIFLSNFDVINTLKTGLGSVSPIEGITWSVAVEEQFYLIWPLLFSIIPKRGYPFIFLSFIAVSLIFRSMNPSDDLMLECHSLSVCGDLAVGGICAYFVLFHHRFKQFFIKLPKAFILFIYLSGILYLMYGNVFSDHLLYAAFSRLLSTLFFAFIILEQNYSMNSFYKFSKNKTLTFWGKYTYGLYLLHQIVFFGLDFFLIRFNLINTPNIVVIAGTSIIGLSCSLLLSYFSYEWYEKRFLTLKNKFSFIKTADTHSKNLKSLKRERISS